MGNNSKQMSMFDEFEATPLATGTPGRAEPSPFRKKARARRKHLPGMRPTFEELAEGARARKGARPAGDGDGGAPGLFSDNGSTRPEEEPAEDSTRPAPIAPGTVVKVKIGDRRDLIRYVGIVSNGVTVVGGSWRYTVVIHAVEFTRLCNPTDRPVRYRYYHNELEPLADAPDDLDDLFSSFYNDDAAGLAGLLGEEIAGLVMGRPEGRRPEEYAPDDAPGFSADVLEWALQEGATYYKETGGGGFMLYRPARLTGWGMCFVRADRRGRPVPGSWIAHRPAEHRPEPTRDAVPVPYLDLLQEPGGVTAEDMRALHYVRDGNYHEYSGVELDRWYPAGPGEPVPSRGDTFLYNGWIVVTEAGGRKAYRHHFDNLADYLDYCDAESGGGARAWSQGMHDG